MILRVDTGTGPNISPQQQNLIKSLLLKTMQSYSYIQNNTRPLMPWSAQHFTHTLYIWDWQNECKIAYTSRNEIKGIYDENRFCKPTFYLGCNFGIELQFGLQQSLLPDLSDPISILLYWPVCVLLFTSSSNSHRLDKYTMTGGAPKMRNKEVQFYQGVWRAGPDLYFRLCATRKSFAKTHWEKIRCKWCNQT